RQIDGQAANVEGEVLTVFGVEAANKNSVTDGSAGDPALRAAKLPAEEMAKRKAALSALREAESRAACAEYEVDRFDCLGGPDGNLQPTAALNTAMAQLIADLRPAVIYHPSLLDAHSDHWNTTRILRHALADLPEIAKSVRLRGYEVWMPAIPNRFADITEEMPRKQRAFAHFVSQNATIDYPRAIGGLNTYRSIYFQGGKGYCEAFQELSFAEYETLSDAITAQSQAKPDSHGDPSHS
ncbi:MAG: PIG-L deacetylase family protein, partial [Mangrovicoccus sp.]